MFGSCVFGKIASASNNLKMILNATKSKVPHISYSTALEAKFHSVSLYDTWFSRQFRFLVSP